MRRFFVLLLAACGSSQQAPPPAAVAPPQVAAAAATPRGPTPPVAMKKPHSQTVNGVTLSDDYFWTREKDSPDVVAYLNAENAYTAAMTKDSAALQDTLYKEMVARLKEDDVSVPFRDNGFFYYQRIEKGQQYRVLCRKSARGAAKDDRTGATATAPEEVLVDLNEIAKDHKFVALGETAVSEDGTRLAYALDTTGFRQFDLHVKDLASGKVYPETMPRVDSLAWAADGKTLFYVTEDATTKRPNQLHRHVLGTDPSQDALVYEEKDEMFNLLLGETRSRAYLLAESFSATTSEARVLRTDRPTAEWKVIEPRQHDVRYTVDHRGDSFLIVTNAPATPGGPKALNNRLVSAPVASPGRAHWKEIIPHRSDVYLLGIDVFADFMVTNEMRDALPHLRILTVKGAPVEIPQPEAVYELGSAENRDFKVSSFRYEFQSPVTPRTVLDYDLKTGKSTLLKKDEVPGGYDSARYTTERIHATAKDGTQIPISLVHKKDLGAGPHPTLLYAYGSYGAIIPMVFQQHLVSLLDRGGVYAFAHIRGGGDLGKAWHEGGRMAFKMNTFTDFIACGEELVKDGRTRSDILAIQGGSAGGLLMGAVTNLRPDLWKAVVAHVPFVDVMNTMLDETIPLTVGEFEEWGNPKKKDEFDVMMAYSPYDNIAKKDYPAILVTTSYNDSQVGYWEPTKYVARLRALKTDSHPLYFKINMEPAGHGGQSGRYNRLHETAFWMAFVFQQIGLA